MKNAAALALSLVFALSFADAAKAQVTLDIAGGLSGETAVFTVGGTPPPGEFVILTLSDTKGPLPVGLLLPGQPGAWDQDLSMFNYPAFFQVAPVTNPFAVIPLAAVTPAFAGLHLFSQAWTVPGPTSFLDQKSNVVTLLFGAHGVSTPTLSPPLAPHAFFNAVPLASGGILVTGGGNGIGGAGSASAEVYDPKTAEFAATANLPAARAGGVAIRLNDGRVLLAGGLDGTGAVTAACELYDPSTNTFAATGSLLTGRALFAGAKLADGRVLVCGGSTSVSGTDVVSQLLALVSNATSSAETYNPATGTWSGAAAMPATRSGHIAAALPDGRVLVAGGVQPGILGIPQFLTTASRYNPTTNAWNATASMGTSGRALSSAAVLNDGRVMVAGGLNANILALTASAVADVSIFNNANNTWQNGPNLSAGRYTHTLTTLPDGRVVAAGGLTGTVSTTMAPTTLASVEAYTPAPSAWAPLFDMLEPRSAAGAALTPDGKRIVVIGGANDFGPIDPPTSELYVP
ncbi:MAG TPA: kelch repeat-containing protein [Planctomycetota bacterium]|nr:kelch repeat-containing protein [Planctomycetota bacterium]